MIHVLQIGPLDPLYRQACALREDVLLGPIGYDMGRFKAEFPGLEERSEHFVAVFDHPTGPRVVGCAQLVPGDPDRSSGRLMQMAVDRQRQGEGIGRRLVTAVERRAFGELGLTELHCHALQTVSGFYNRIGWAVEGPPFTEAGKPHRRYVMRASTLGAATTPLDEIEL